MVNNMWQWNDGTDYLMHHGIKGQKWGIRNYQYEDGTLTPAGRERYRNGDGTRSTTQSNKPHSRTKKTGQGYAKPVSLGSYYSPTSVTHVPHAIASIQDIDAATDTLRGINEIYTQIKNMDDDELIASSSTYFNYEIQQYLKSGVLTKNDIMTYLERLVYRLGESAKDTKGDFVSTLQKKADDEYNYLIDVAKKKEKMKKNNRTARVKAKSQKTDMMN